MSGDTSLQTPNLFDEKITSLASKHELAKAET
jgi:hypothetical protein